MQSYPLTLVFKLRRLIISRLLVATVFLVLAIFTTEFNRALLYGSIFCVCLLSLFYAWWLVRGRHLAWLAVVQIVFDLAIETVLVCGTGGVDSGFVMLYILTIIASGLVISPRSSLYIAVVSSILFLVAAAAHAISLQFGFTRPWISWSMVDITAPSEPWVYRAYVIYVKVAILFLVGFLVRNLLLRMGRMEERIQTQERLSFLGEAVAAIAHEVRNPLAFISGAVELLGRELEGKIDEKGRETMKTIVSESERLGLVFNQILNYSRVDKLELRRFRLGDLLDEIFLLLERNVHFQKNISIKKDYQASTVMLLADRGKLKQVFMNIIVNAFQAMPAGGMLAVEVRLKSGIVDIFFKDTGAGMDSETQKKLFIPFHTNKPYGAGVGLATAHKIVLAHEGILRVKSKPGRGTTVLVRLPIS